MVLNYESHPLRGNIFENMVVIDLLKKKFNEKDKNQDL
jgi:hypothetical protein